MPVKKALGFASALHAASWKKLTRVAAGIRAKNATHTVPEHTEVQQEETVVLGVAQTKRHFSATRQCCVTDQSNYPSWFDTDNAGQRCGNNEPTKHPEARTSAATGRCRRDIPVPQARPCP